jgi:hypothetical protein
MPFSTWEELGSLVVKKAMRKWVSRLKNGLYGLDFPRKFLEAKECQSYHRFPVSNQKPPET